MSELNFEKLMLEAAEESRSIAIGFSKMHPTLASYATSGRGWSDK